MQTSYNPQMAPALLGQIADLSNKTIDSFAAEGGLNPGDVVVRGTNPGKQVKIVEKSTAANAIGVVVHEHKESVEGSGAYYPEGYAVGVMTKGRVWVPVSAAVTAGAGANYDTAKKAFTGASASGDVVALGISCRFVTSTSAAGMAEIEIFGPAASGVAGAAGPKGDKGDKGDTGAKGATGAAGASVTGLTINLDTTAKTVSGQATMSSGNPVNITGAIAGE